MIKEVFSQTLVGGYFIRPIKLTNRHSKMTSIKKFFSDLFSKKNQPLVDDILDPVVEPTVHISTTKYIQHSQGDFYVVDGDCITCGAPEAEAPDLIKHQKGEYGHCYFKRQPETEDEINRAINAVAVSCISGLRYRGTNENILMKLYEIGEQNQCDNKPIYNYKEVIRNKVEFSYKGTIQKLQNILKTKIPKRDYYKILDFKTNEKDFFQFILRWTDGLTGTIYKCNFKPGGQCKIEMSKEKDGYFGSIRNHSEDLNNILSNEENIFEIHWFNFDGEDKPF